MADTNILSAARSALRITSHTFDDEINMLIDAARIELVNCGVDPEKAADDTDAAVRLAVLVFVKANFGMDNPDAERLGRSFESMATHLKMTQAYGQELS